MLQPGSGIQITADELAGILSTIKWVIGGAGAVIGSALGFLFVLTYRVGGYVRELKHVGESMLTIKANADKVPVIETRVGTLEGVVGRHNSDIRGLLRGSNPAFNGEV